MNMDNPVENSRQPHTDDEIKAQLKELLENLSGREGEVLRLRFGLTDGKVRTREEVAQIFGISRERVRQIEYKVLHRSVHRTRSKKISDYYK